MAKNNLRKLNIILILGLVVLLGLILLVQSGVFAKEPTVEVTPNNCYSETLMVITDEDYRPYSFYGKNGEFSGHDVELIAMLANEMEMNLDLRFLPWDEAIKEAAEGNADVLMTCDYSDSFNGVDELIKSESVSEDDFIVYSKKKITSVDQLYNMKIGIMRDGNVTPQIKMLNLYDKCILYSDSRDAMMALVNDSVDCVAMRAAVGTVLLDELNAKGIKGRITIGLSYMCFGINDDKPELVAEINGALEELKMNGELDLLREKWLTTFIRPYTLEELLKENIWMCFIIICAIAFAVLNYLSGRIKQIAAEEEELRNAQVIEMLAQDFGCINYVKLTDSVSTDIMVNYRTSEELNELIPGWEEVTSFSEKLQMLIDTLIYEQDREQFHNEAKRSVVLAALENSDTYYVNTRVVINGEIQYYQMKYSAFRVDGKIVGIVAGLHSVDEQTRNEMKMQEQLQDALSMAQSANKAKTTFLNNMSHDIRTPMNAIIGYTGLATKHIDDRERTLDYLGKIEQSSKHLLSLINDVLDMSRIESGKMGIEEKEENLTEIIFELRDMVQSEIQARRHTFNIDIVNVNDEVVLCDKLRLNQVLLNILSNSIKYTKDGGVINLRLTERKTKLTGYATYEFKIKDNGMGMDEAFLKTLFEPFARAKSSTVSGIQGTGLGMAITKNIIDMMGGSVVVNSEIDKGTEFIVCFDFRIATGSGNAAAKESKEETKIDFQEKKVLLVEDNALNREIATELLEEYGFIVDTASDGDIAVEKVKSASAGDFDLILMDVQMPSMDGYEATKLIRELGTEISKIPIIAMTANAFEEDRRTALDAGMDEHIAKPIDMEKLKEVLSKFL